VVGLDCVFDYFGVGVLGPAVEVPVAVLDLGCDVVVGVVAVEFAGVAVWGGVAAGWEGVGLGHGVVFSVSVVWWGDG